MKNTCTLLLPGQFSKLLTLLTLIISAFSLNAQPLIKSVAGVDPGNTILTGATFTYQLTYTCSSTSGPCLNAQIIDLLPPEVQYMSTVPASPTGNIAAINVTNNFMGTGRTRVQFLLINSLPAGNSGDLLINVRFPNGSTPNGTVATNTATATNLGSSPGSFTSSPVSVTGLYTNPLTAPVVNLSLISAPANLDLSETYRLRFSVPNSNGVGNYTAAGPVVVTLAPGTVFNGATPAADCQPGCVGTTPATISFTSPFAVPITPGSNSDILVNVTFPSATFPSGSTVTTSANIPATLLGEAPASFSTSITHPVTTFVASPQAGFSINLTGTSPNPPTLNQTFSYELQPGNNGNVPLDNLMVIGTLPIQLQVSSVSTGAYSGLADFAAGEGVRVSYEKNTAPGVFTLWGSSPNISTNTTLTAPPPGLGAGEYITRIRWEYGQAQVGMSPTSKPLITGRIINPSNAGTPVVIGNSIQFCADLSAVYIAGPSNVTRNDCENFTLSGPFVQFNPASENQSGGGPFNPGQIVSWRMRVRSAPQSSNPVALTDVVAVSLLDERLNYTGWTFESLSTGLTQPTNFTAIPGVIIDGKTYTLLRWWWTGVNGMLGVNSEVYINVTTTIRNLPSSTTVRNRFLLHNNGNALTQRCSGNSLADASDLDADGNLTEMFCYSDGTANIACLPLSLSVSAVSNACLGSTVSLSALTSGFSLAYQWYKNGAMVTGLTSATTATLSLTNVQLSDAGNYQVVGSAACQSVTSAAFALSINELAPPAAILSLKASESGCPVRLVGRATGTAFVFTSPNGYVFSNVYRSGGTYDVIGEGVVKPGIYTLTSTYTNNCGTNTVSQSVTVTRSCP